MNKKNFYKDFYSDVKMTDNEKKIMLNNIKKQLSEEKSYSLKPKFRLVESVAVTFCIITCIVTSALANVRDPKDKEILLPDETQTALPDNTDTPHQDTEHSENQTVCSDTEAYNVSGTEENASDIPNLPANTDDTPANPYEPPISLPEENPHQSEETHEETAVTNPETHEETGTEITKITTVTKETPVTTTTAATLETPATTTTAVTTATTIATTRETFETTVMETTTADATRETYPSATYVTTTTPASSPEASYTQTTAASHIATDIPETTVGEITTEPMAIETEESSTTTTETEPLSPAPAAEFTSAYAEIPPSKENLY